MTISGLVFITFSQVKQTHFLSIMTKLPKEAICQKWAKVGYFKGQTSTEYDTESCTSIHQIKDKRPQHKYLSLIHI